MKSLTANQSKLGFIGLGNMGSRIAQRLLDHGYTLSVNDRNIATAKTIASQGGIVAKSIQALASTVDVVLSCLTNDEAVRSVYTGAEGVFSGARPGTVVLEMSTISPDTSRELHSLAARAGIQLLDVAISGSTPAAEQGTLTLLVGGDGNLFRAAEPIFLAIAKRYFLLGGAGAGTTMKLVVNTLLGVGMQAIAEAVVLGEKAGLDRKRLLERPVADSCDRSGSRGKAGECGTRRLPSAISPPPDEQRLCIDSEGGGKRSCPHAGD